MRIGFKNSLGHNISFPFSRDNVVILQYYIYIISTINLCIRKMKANDWSVGQIYIGERFVSIIIMVIIPQDFHEENSKLLANVDVSIVTIWYSTSIIRWFNHVWGGGRVGHTKLCIPTPLCKALDLNTVSTIALLLCVYRPLIVMDSYNICLYLTHHTVSYRILDFMSRSLLLMSV